MKIPTQPAMKFLGKFDGTRAGAVRMTHDSPWEIHPRGDECLHLLSGALDVVIEAAGGDQVIELRTGAACVVPRGRWHRLVVREAGDLLFLTPTSGTRHRPIGDPAPADASSDVDRLERTESPSRETRRTGRRAARR